MLRPALALCPASAPHSRIISVRYAVFLPGRLPLLPASLLVYLLHHARITGTAVTVSSVSGFAQTFPVVLDRAALPALQNELKLGAQRLFFRVPGGFRSPEPAHP